MASIVLGLGTSHTPMLNVRRDEWCRFSESDPTIAALRDKAGRLTTYAALATLAGPKSGEWLDPASLFDRYDRAQAGIDILRDILARAAPDIIVIIGDDQHELLREENMPAFQVYWGSQITSRPVAPRLPWDWYNLANTRNYDAEPRRYPVAQVLALKIIETMIDAGFDIGTSSGLADGAGENHAIGFVRQRIMPDKAVPVVPILVNTFYPPNQPLPRRCYAFGRMLRHAIESWQEPKRVAVVASGGLSHFTVDDEFDRGVLDMLRRKDVEGLTTLPLAKLNSGNSEIRNWIAVAGAVAGLDLHWSDYIPGHRTAAGTGTGIAFAAWQ
jgi:Catalytic LigB subunit of aromatic ring-opening dioxygenase